MFTNFIYPKCCLSCDFPLFSKKNPLFCSPCLQQFEIINPLSRCLQCFNEGDNTTNHGCLKCQKKPSEISQLASLFDYHGPAAVLIKQLKYAKSFKLAKGIGAYMAAYLIKYNWELPDLIIPVPISTLRKWDRGFNQSQLIAESIGKILKIPVNNPLKRRNRSTSQAAMNQEDRKKMDENNYQLKKNNTIQDKRLLLIDDVMTTGTTLHICAKTLHQACPQNIQALTFCLN